MPGLRVNGSLLRLESSTIANHRPGPDSGESSAIRVTAAREGSVIRNSIIWEDEIAPIFTENPSKLEVRHSLVTGGWEGEGNLEDDPLFVRPGAWDDDPLGEESVWLGGDFHLRPGSPAVDAGLAEGLAASDLDGAPRHCGASVDLGAYELPSGDCATAPPPAARFTVTPLEGESPLRVQVDAADSLESGLDLTAEWDFGDGVTASGIRAEHTYGLPGAFTITLSVSDELGRVAVSRADVQVLPALRAGFTVTASEGRTPLDIGVDASSTLADGLNVTYAWDFGDGAIATGIRARHTYTVSGTFPVTLTVRDEHGRSASTHQEVRVLFRPGSVDISPWTSASVGEVSVPGKAALEDGCLIFTPAGSLLASRPADGFHFIHHPLRGNAVLTARISDLRFPRDASVQTGLMFRVSLDPDAPFGAILLETSRGIERLVKVERNYFGGEVSVSEIRNADATSRIRIERDRLSFRTFVEKEPGSWESAGTIRLWSLNRPVRVLLGGIAASGGGDNSASLVARACVDVEGGGPPPSVAAT